MVRGRGPRGAGVCGEGEGARGAGVCEEVTCVRRVNFY